MQKPEIGTLYGVGVGPGDPELITRKAARILTEVDWIFCPAGKKGNSFAWRIVEPLGLPSTKFRTVSLEMSPEDGTVSYKLAVEEILAELYQGKSVAWITQGDPLFYSTFLHLYAELQQRAPAVPLEIVPGVSSINAAAARVYLPIAYHQEKVAVVPAASGLENLPALLQDFTTIFLLKVHTVFDRLLSQLTVMPEVYAVYLEQVGTGQERIVKDLETLRGQKLPYFSLVILRKER